jgi:hypothetical protein
MTTQDRKVPGHFPYWAMIMIIAFYAVLPPLYYALKQQFQQAVSFTLFDYYVMSFIMLFITTGGYQLYFWCQKAYIGEAIEIRETRLDSFIPKIPSAIYVYNLLYYIGFGLCIVSIVSYKHFAHVLAVGLGLLCFHALFFTFIPTKLPATSREKQNENEQKENAFIELTQSIDDVYNAFPSAHVSLSILIFYLTRATFGPITILFPMLITASCLLTKQHFVIDCAGGVVYAIIYIALVNAFYPFKVFR